jgi:hypothetical protein
MKKTKKVNHQKKQFEQTVNKFQSIIEEFKETLELMPTKGGAAIDCQKTCILTIICELDRNINGIELEDFIPNEYSGNFKYSY